jgi:dipeptidyl aminopeptidase/acylaminoacyl peptidase
MMNSPFTPEAVAVAASPLFEVRCHQGRVYWVKRRPSEGGRQVVMEYDPDSGETRCLTPPFFSTQSRVHEYGGGSYALSGQFLFFVNAADQCIYQQSLDFVGDPVALTRPEARYGDLIASKNAEFLVAVREKHEEGGVTNDLVRINIATKTIDVLANGSDFYAAPALNATDTELVFLSWSHPNMPWDKTTLWQMNLITYQATKKIDSNEAIYQPGFNTKGELFYISDRNGFWNVYVDFKNICPVDRECGYPLWVLGTNHLVFTDKKAWFISGRPGEQTISTNDGHALSLCFTDFQPTLAYNTLTQSLYFIAGHYHEPDALYEYQLTDKKLTLIAKSAEHKIDPICFSKPIPICLEKKNTRVFGFYYPPTTRETEPPAMIVNAHGGPNASATTQCQFKIQFWTSRGFAYLDVNYRGSTGYGRDYRRSLNGLWGVADVDDCCSLTRYCVEQSLCDPHRLFIRGQSAGGLTALSACVFHTLFLGGVSCYGIGDLTKLIADTHKFESHYLDQLVGPYPEEKDRYLDRSPAYHLDQLTVPILFLQGLEDKVVPVAQTKAITDKLDACGKPYTYIEFPNEGHGFKRAENLIATMLAELSFYNSIGYHS